MFQQVAKARDRALEGTVFSFLYGLAGDYIELEREGVKFDFSTGHVSFAKMEFKEKVIEMVDQQLAAQGLKLRMAYGCLQQIEMEEFYPQDVLDGDFDYPISAKVDGLVIVLEPTEELGEPPKVTPSKDDGEEKKEAEEPEINMLLETFLQGFGYIEITKIHVRYQDPKDKINIALNIGMGEYGSIKLWEPKGAEGPKSFRSVDKENEGKEKPLQDVVKQFFFPFPSIEINPNAETMIGSDYNFEPQSQPCAVIPEGSLFTCSIALDSRNLGQDVTIHDPKLRDPLVFRLERAQIKTLLKVAQHLFPKELKENPDILVGADVLDNVGVTIGKKQLQHFFLDKQEAEALPEDAPGFFLDRAARIKIDRAAVHDEASFQEASNIQLLQTPDPTESNRPASEVVTPFSKQDPQLDKSGSSKANTTRKPSLWQRFKQRLSCKGGAKDQVIDCDEHSTSEYDEDSQADRNYLNYTHTLGENALTAPIQLGASWGMSFDGLEVSNVPQEHVPILPPLSLQSSSASSVIGWVKI